MDEAHHLLPAPSDLVSVTLPRTLAGMMLITVHPEHVSPAVLGSIDVVIAIGGSADPTLRAFGEAVGERPPPRFPPRRDRARRCCGVGVRRRAPR